MVLFFFQIRYQLLSFDENLISDTLGLLFPALKKRHKLWRFLVPFIFQWDSLILKLTFSIFYSYHCNNFFILKHFINDNIIFYNQLPIPFKSIKIHIFFPPLDMAVLPNLSFHFQEIKKCVFLKAVGRCRRFFRIMIMSKWHRIFWRILANQAVTHCPSDSLVTCYPWYLILSTSVSFFRLLLKTQESTICNRPTKKIIIKIGTIGTW